MKKLVFLCFALNAMPLGHQALAVEATQKNEESASKNQIQKRFTKRFIGIAQQFKDLDACASKETNRSELGRFKSNLANITKGGNRVMFAVPYEYGTPSLQLWHSLLDDRGLNETQKNEITQILSSGEQDLNVTNFHVPNKDIHQWQKMNSHIIQAIKSTDDSELFNLSKSAEYEEWKKANTSFGKSGKNFIDSTDSTFYLEFQKDTPEYNAYKKAYDLWRDMVCSNNTSIMMAGLYDIPIIHDCMLEKVIDYANAEIEQQSNSFQKSLYCYALLSMPAEEIESCFNQDGQIQENRGKDIFDSDLEELGPVKGTFEKYLTLKELNRGKDIFHTDLKKLKQHFHAVEEVLTKIIPGNIHLKEGLEQAFIIMFHEYIKNQNSHEESIEKKEQHYFQRLKSTLRHHLNCSFLDAEPKDAESKDAKSKMFIDTVIKNCKETEDNREYCQKNIKSFINLNQKAVALKHWINMANSKIIEEETLREQIKLIKFNEELQKMKSEWGDKNENILAFLPKTIDAMTFVSLCKDIKPNSENTNAFVDSHGKNRIEIIRSWEQELEEIKKSLPRELELDDL